ncbi:L-asparaginase [Zymomonas mobilis]|uniref:L-asparaginase n=2 Tax=Zymomonas mobilis TaxID=542 RepID=A0A542W326_ZYMMB|nr:L-asparaginase [Zymomonas mobilis]
MIFKMPVKAISSTMALAICMTMGSAPAKSMNNSNINTAHALPRILVLATGGTISGKKNEMSAIGYNAGGVTGQQLIEDIPELSKLAQINVEQIANIGSQDMNDDIWLRLAKRIQEVVARNEADGIVITHGTDTMEETAFFLDNVIHTDKPVILTGAMRPSTAISADGPGNLYEAIEVATNAKAKGHGVMIVMNDTIHSARWASKTHTTSVETFQSINAGPIGYVDPASVRFVQPPMLMDKRYPIPAAAPLPRVEILYAHSGMGASIINDLVKDGVKAIVLAGVGDGNSSKPVIDALNRAVKQGVIVVRSSRTGSGFVNRNVEVDDDKNSFVASYDLSPQKSRILLQILISNGKTKPSEIQTAFESGFEN